MGKESETDGREREGKGKQRRILKSESQISDYRTHSSNHLVVEKSEVQRQPIIDSRAYKMTEPEPSFSDSPKNVRVGSFGEPGGRWRRGP